MSSPWIDVKRQAIRDAIRALLLGQAGIEYPLPSRELRNVVEDVPEPANPDVSVPQSWKSIYAAPIS